ncbi:hypothetical protein L916_19424, partial [Phytophthora nicotianae]
MRTLLLVVVALQVAITSATTALTDPALAPFYDTVGLACNKRADCGYVPALACIEGLGYVCQVIEVLNEATGEKEAQQGLTSTGDTVDAAYCVEKNLFGPFTYKDLLTTLVAFTCTALGAGGGVGGGGLLVPMYILGGLNPKHAIPLSKVTIFGSAVAMYVVNCRGKHPLNRNRPLIDFGLVGLMEPTTLIGTVFGVMLNHIFPNWLILVLLVTLLSFITYKTILKGNTIQDKEDNLKLALIKSTLKGGPNGGGRGRKWSIYRRFDVEVAARRWLNKTRRRRRVRLIREEDEADFLTLPPLNDRKPTSSDPLLQDQNKRQFGTFSSDDGKQAQRCSAIERREARVFPFEYLWPLALSWLLILVQSILRGGHGAPSAIGIKCNSSIYWLLTLLPLAVPISVSLWMGYRLRLLNRIKVQGNYPFVEGDIHWIKRRVLMFPAVCTTAGVAAGLLGIGGGMVKGPIMLEAGVLPAVQTATASFMILFTASSTTLQFAINGQFPGELQFDYMA